MYLFVDKGGFFHRLHPNTKTIAVLGLVFAALLVTHPGWACIPLILAMLPLIVGGGMKHAWRIAPLVVILFVLSIYIWTFMYFNPDDEYIWWRVGKYAFPRETILFGLGMGVRISAMLLAGLAFLTVTRVEDFTAGLHRMGLPFGMCFGLSLSFRLLPLFLGTAVSISEAQRSRGLDLESGGAIARARKYVPLLVPVFISSIRNADGLALALESKGFGRTNPRTYLRDYPQGVKDLLVLLVVEGVIVVLWILKVKGYGGI